MRWLGLAVLLSVAMAGQEARGQWIFGPSSTSQDGRDKRQAGQQAPPFGTTWRAQAPVPDVQPGDSIQWDQSGVIGRRDRDAWWRHEEAMTGIDAYLHGLHDGIDTYRPWYWNPLVPGPIGPVVGPHGHGKPAKPKGPRP